MPNHSKLRKSNFENGLDAMHGRPSCGCFVRAQGSVTLTRIGSYRILGWPNSLDCIVLYISHYITFYITFNRRNPSIDKVLEWAILDLNQ